MIKSSLLENFKKKRSVLFLRESLNQRVEHKDEFMLSVKLELNLILNAPSGVRVGNSSDILLSMSSFIE